MKFNLEIEADHSRGFVGGLVGSRKVKGRSRLQRTEPARKTDMGKRSQALLGSMCDRSIFLLFSSLCEEGLCSSKESEASSLAHGSG